MSSIDNVLQFNVLREAVVHYHEATYNKIDKTNDTTVVEWECTSCASSFETTFFKRRSMKGCCSDCEEKKELDGTISHLPFVEETIPIEMRDRLRHLALEVDDDARIKLMGVLFPVTNGYWQRKIESWIAIIEDFSGGNRAVLLDQTLWGTMPTTNADQSKLCTSQLPESYYCLSFGVSDQ